jgi:hypothetical protein
METIITFFISLIINLNDLDRYRISSFVSNDNKSFVEYIKDKNLYFSSFNYKFKNNFNNQIVVPIVSVKEIRFTSYVSFKTVEIEYQKVNCSSKTCVFFFDNFNGNNLTIETISTEILKEKIEVILKKKNDITSTNNIPINKKSKNFNSIISQFKLYEFYNEINRDENLDISLLNELEVKTKNNKMYEIEISEPLAKALGKKSFQTAYVLIKNGKYHLVSKIYINEYINSKNVLFVSNMDEVSDIREYILKNSNLKKLKINIIVDKFKLSFDFISSIFKWTISFDFISSIFKWTISFDFISSIFEGTKKYFYNLLIFISIIPIIFIFNRNLINFYKSRFLFFSIFLYLIILDSIILNYFSIILISILFLMKKKYSKYD